MSWIGAALAALLGLLAAPGAAPAFSGSAITGPAPDARPVYDADLGPADPENTLAVRGTVTGGAAAGELRCTWRDPTGALQELTLDPGPVETTGGTFAATTSLAPVAGIPCRLRLVPQGASLADEEAAAAFGGPRLLTALRGTTPITGPGNPNAGRLRDVSVGVALPAGAARWGAATAVGAPAALEPVEGASPRRGRSPFAGNALLAPASDLAGDPRSGVVVDGRNAFGPWALSAFDAALAGLEGVRIAELRADPLTGATTAVTEEPLLVCPGGIPFADLTPASCPRADDAGVRLERTVTTGADGATLTASDRFISTDARAHALELRYAHRQSGGPGAYRLGWEAGAGFRARAAGETPPSPPGRVSTVELRAEAADPLPGPANPLGAITFSTRPDALRFTGPSAFEAAFTRTVPAAGALQIVQRFAAATDAAALAGHVATAEAEAAASGPRVGFTSPTAAAGFSREYVLTGRAEAPGAIAALVVNGRPVRPAADGSFAVPMELSPGANPVSAEVTDAAGDRAATSATIAFSPPPASASYLRPVYRRGVVTLPVTCQALAGTSCVVRSTLSARFKRKIGRRARFKTVVLQRLQITVPAGTSTVARIRVGARNRALVRKYRRLRARLELVQDGVTTTAGKPARRWYGVTLK